MWQKAVRHFCRAVAFYNPCRCNNSTQLQYQMVEGVQVFQGQFFMALPFVSVIVMAGIPKVGAHEIIERNGCSLLSGQALVEPVVLKGSRYFAQLAKICSRQ